MEGGGEVACLTRLPIWMDYHQSFDCQGGRNWITVQRLFVHLASSGSVVLTILVQYKVPRLYPRHGALAFLATEFSVGYSISYWGALLVEVPKNERKKTKRDGPLDVSRACYAVIRVGC